MMPSSHTSPPVAHPGNNFDAIRVVAASMVLISHHYALTGQTEPSFFNIHSLGGLAVTIFFVVSGYLVNASWQRDPNVWRFALRRFLRIWPALTAVLILTAYGLGAWVTELPVKEYLLQRATADYLQGLWMKIHFVLPGVFEHNPSPRGVNGSLWTIPIEVRCYILLGLAGLLGLLKYRPILLLCIALYMTWFIFRSNADLTGVVSYGSELSAFFLMGVAQFTLQPYWSRRPVFWATAISLGTAAAWAVGWRHTALLIGLPFMVIYAGTRATPIIRRAGRWGDPSYGIYLLAFPIQQTVILYKWPNLGFSGTLALAFATTILLSYASWHMVEKQALIFKPRNAAKPK
ncbi:acyltransferase [Ramlibacter sp. H39-3-26]|uniref:acyltransferase family protein n=1 Tax=Curvibacter soli TaxID=3031331 RepID=UPI0023DC5977|nr:acyltransferase [Ramlibacter sp. H39-3-26]MDF1484466.1 acyltransferase [Ramlibacter sp. H39-3-26]